MSANPIAELLARTEKLEDLSLGAARELRELRPQAQELVDRLDRLEALFAEPAVPVTSELAPVEPPVIVPPKGKTVPAMPRTETWTLQSDDITPGIIAW